MSDYNKDKNKDKKPEPAKPGQTESKAQAEKTQAKPVTAHNNK